MTEVPFSDPGPAHGRTRDITATNAAATVAALDELIEVLQRLRSDLAAGRELERVFNDAADWKRVLEASGTPDT